MAADKNIQLESASAEIELTSEMGVSSARMMKEAYLPRTGAGDDLAANPPPGDADRAQPVDTGSGPNAVVYITRIMTRTPEKEIKRLLDTVPDEPADLHSHDFFTVVISASVRMDDPSTTRFVNTTATFDLPSGMTILDFSPKERGSIGRIREDGGCGLLITPHLDFCRSMTPGEAGRSTSPKNRFEIRISAKEKIQGFYSGKNGYFLETPVLRLLEYQGIRKNEQTVYWELYTPMPVEEIETSGKESLAIFALIIRTPSHTVPSIKIVLEGKVKGELWGVVPLKGNGII
jgi:hypothetical protein